MSTQTNDGKTNKTNQGHEQIIGSALGAGTSAPDFTLPDRPDGKISLADFRGRPVILAFYPADWSPVCGDQTSNLKVR